MTELTGFSAVKLREMIRGGDCSPAEVVTAFHNRITSDTRGLNAVVSLRHLEDVLAEVHALDPKDMDQPLWGLPLAPKDLVETEGLRTTHGSPLFADHIPEVDSNLAANLRRAGGIFIGKTNTPEWGIGSNTYNPVHGITRNPFDPSRSAGGSSGGAAVALAAGFLPLADGSDTMGSLRNPAGWNDVYGFRPSFGMVSAKSVGERFLSQLSTAGPMARHPEDLRLLLDVMARPNPMVPHAAPAQRPAPKVIHWIGDWAGHLAMEPGVLETCETALSRLEGIGFVVETKLPKISPDALWESWTTLRSWSIAGELPEFLEDPKKRDRLKPEVVWEIERGLGFSTKEIFRASQVRSDWFRELQSSDVLWAMPSAQMFPFAAEVEWPREIAGRTMDTYHRWMEVVIAASLIGVPAICLPAGFHLGLPMGLQLVGPRGTDHALIKIAERYDPLRPERG